MELSGRRYRYQIGKPDPAALSQDRDAHILCRMPFEHAPKLVFGGIVNCNNATPFNG